MKIQEALNLLNIPAQWQKAKGKGIKIALVYCPVHADRVPFVKAVNYDPTIDSHWHGSAEAWILHQVAPEADIYSIKGYNKGWSLAKAVDWCIENRIGIISMSFYTADTQEAKDALQRALNAGIKIVAGAGNNGYDKNDNDSEVVFPGNFPGVLTVANLWKDDIISGDSSGGPEVEIAAPGSAIETPWPPGKVGGTSFATPFIAGIVAIVLEPCPWATPTQIETFIVKNARDILLPGKDDHSGYGIFRFPDEWEIPMEVECTVNIIEEQYAWAKELSYRNITKYIVLHHEAGWGTAQEIHWQHVNKEKWAGIGYNFYVRQDGHIYRGRPINAVGAHVEGYNSVSVGICAEGYYHTSPTGSKIIPDTVMPDAQLKSLIELVAYCREVFPYAEVVGHRDLIATACPGEYFPFEQIVNPIIQEDEEEMIRYQKLSDIPNEYGFRDVIEKLMNAKIISGDGSDQAGNNDVIDLSHDQVRSLIFEYRGGAFDRKLIAEGLTPAVNV